MQITYYGHSALGIESANGLILIDPFISENPRASLSLDELLVQPITAIILTHGHSDHLGDTIAIAQQTWCKVIASVELCAWLAKNGIQTGQLVEINVGGRVAQDEWKAHFVPAIHSNSTPDGAYAGLAMGVILTINTKRIYHAGDTALFQDMALVAPVDVAFLPIGGRYTMDAEDAIRATELIKPQIVVPIHYNTRSSIKSDELEFARQVMLRQYAVPKVLRPGQYVVLDE